METGNLVKYLKKVGDPITAGDVLCEVETDKATVGFEMQDEGFLAQILVPAGIFNYTFRYQGSLSWSYSGSHSVQIS